LFTAGNLRLLEVRLEVKALLKIQTGRVARNKAMPAVVAGREKS
jgi:hypothetical protein